MNKHLAKTIQIYTNNGINFDAILDWHFRNGIVFNSFDEFAMCFYAYHENPDLPVNIKNSDTLFVSMCCGNMQRCLAAFQNDFEFIAFQRSFKNSPRVRIYSMKKFAKMINK